MYYLGIDVARLSCECAVIGNNGEGVCKPFGISTNKNEYSRLTDKLKKLNIAKNELICGLEATGNLWENLYEYLTTKGYKVMVLNPYQTNKYHQAMLKKAKTDAIDAYVIAGLLRSGHARESHIPDDTIQSLRDLVRLRASYQADIKTYKRKAYSLLNLVFPEYLMCVKDPFAIVSTEILINYPTAFDFKALKPKHVLKIARHYQGNNFDEALASKIISAAKDSVYSGKAKSARGISLKSLLMQIKSFKEQIDMLTSEIDDILRPKDPSSTGLGDNILSIPGVGPNTIASILSEVGNITRFSNQREFIGYIGLYPEIKESGESAKKPILTKRGSPLLKHALYLAAVASLKHNPIMRSVYNKKKSQGKSSKQALIVVARKLACVIYSMLKSGTQYCESRVLVAA